MNIDIRIADCPQTGGVVLTISSPDSTSLVSEVCKDTDEALSRAMAWADAMKQVAAIPTYPGTLQAEHGSWAPQTR